MEEVDEWSRKCVLCDENLANSETRSLQEKAIETCIISSKKRRDGKHVILKQRKFFIVHALCAKNYNYIGARHSLPQASSTRLRSSPLFDYENLCFFCATDASDAFMKAQSKKKVHLRTITRKVVNENFQINLKSILETRTDAKSYEILSRLNSVHNLLDVNARYHDSCYNKYRLATKVSDAGADGGSLAISKICTYIYEHQDECQFSINEILESCNLDKWPSFKYLKKKLYETFGKDICIHSSRDGPIISFLNTGLKHILTEQWYSTREEDEEKERRRIIEVAAKIILEDIRKMFYNISAYPSTDSLQLQIENDIPDSLRFFLNEIILNNKKSVDKCNKKIISIAHAIIAATRPRSFLSSLLINLGVTLNSKFGSKELLQILNAMGFCASYDESQLLQSSILMSEQEFEYGSSSVQVVADNADHNTQTLDGKGTLHVMGRMEIITPKNTLPQRVIPRCLNKPSAEVLGKFGKVELKYFRKSCDPLGKIISVDLEKNNKFEENIDVLPHDFLWLCGKYLKPFELPGWKGFMQKITEDLEFCTSRTRILPIIDNPASSYDSIFTVLTEANEQREKLGQKNCFVTFDLPLYKKAQEILACSENLSPIIVRLGGFHILLSYLGSIGNIMAGSGLKELLSQIYAENSVSKILSGDAYARAIRAHVLAQSALANIILSEIELSPSEELILTELLNNVDTDTLTKVEDPIFKQVKMKFYNHCCKLKNKGPVATLWLQYFNMVSLAKNFIAAERSGNWNLHLECVKHMIPFFYASGHHNYGKMCHLYLQDMGELEQKMDYNEYEVFTKRGFFTVRLTNKFWSGIWSDMSIEMCLMRLMKVRGGLIGRGFTDSIMANWTLTMPLVTEITEFITQFCGVSFTTSEQHVDARPTRVNRDAEDTKKLEEYFKAHYPFVSTDSIMSISSGVKGDESINCHKSFEVGLQVLRNCVGKTFNKMKFEKKFKVLPLQAANSTKIDKNTIILNPTLVFQRISATVNNKEELKQYLEHELASYPVSIFDDGCLRKTQKSKLFDNFSSIDNFRSDNYRHVIDGGFLLHKVVWPKKICFGDVLQRYVNFVSQHYKKNSVVVFDGYPEIPNLFTKTAERLRRKTCEIGTEIVFNEATIVNVKQEVFLANDKNKKRLIAVLRKKLHVNGFRTKVAEEDADLLIVQTAINESKDEEVVIVGEDIDILVILTQLAPDNKKIFFCKPGKGSTVESVYNTDSFNHAKVKKIIAFVHCFTGCDTTSAFFNQGKGKIIKVLEKNSALINEISVFYSPNSDTEELRKAGENVIMALYGARRLNISLNEFRYNCFKQCTFKTNFKLEHLPPTESAAAQHSYRVYHQIQQWLGHTLNPLSWGWKNSKYGLQPIFCESTLVPQSILKQIRCTCTVDCKKSCGCVKQGLRCSELCVNCCGQNCSNSEKQYVPEITEDEIEEEEEEEEHCLESTDDFTFPLLPDSDTDDVENEIESDGETATNDDTIPAKKMKLV